LRRSFTPKVINVSSHKARCARRQASKPNETVWVIECERAKYSVRLTPNLAAKVERIQQ
jgi:hypothetical protein